ncbi:TIGR02452 family protein [Hymenobacter actinosclerus]|uniref:TIGR02452 family protein n=1 Tax=Hymenobacter actinosclerus TaxID=82805 RepID=A0A1I0BTB8_9BACT|nr:TIGR02452 family protein [Hymenobacter actinosclerus]SET09861.1 TIGR02452 family protein [Hymenobacter actinosclerus]
MSQGPRRHIAATTLEALQQGFYQSPTGATIHINELQRAAETGTRLYRPEEGAELLAQLQTPTTAGPAEVRVYQATTLEAVAQLKGEFDRVGCLNFASARNPGGGFLRGSQAQEESLARSSGLYPCLMRCPEMYAHNRRPGSTGLYSDYLGYSPAVPILRTDAGDWRPQPQLVDFITAPAVNAGALRRNSPDLLPQLEPVMRHRLRLVLAVAARHGIEALVLGAWGCGVFANDPAQVARIFAETLADPAIRTRFRRLDFAIYDPKPPHNTLKAFEQELAPLMAS